MGRPRKYPLPESSEPERNPEYCTLTSVRVHGENVGSGTSIDLDGQVLGGKVKKIECFGGAVLHVWVQPPEADAPLKRILVRNWSYARE